MECYKLVGGWSALQKTKFSLNMEGSLSNDDGDGHENGKKKH